MLTTTASVMVGNEALLEEHVIAAVCDLDAFSVDDWEQARADLEAAGPKGGWGLGGRGGFSGYVALRAR